MPHSSAESWSVVHVRWEVVEEKFYQRLFSGTPCTSCQAQGLPGVVRERPELVQEEGVDRYRCDQAGVIPQVMLYKCTIVHQS